MYRGEGENTRAVFAVSELSLWPAKAGSFEKITTDGALQLSISVLLPIVLEFQFQITKLKSWTGKVKLPSSGGKPAPVVGIYFCSR